jgi:hypothetical protein
VICIFSLKEDMIMIYAYRYSFQGILRLRGRPTVAYDQQGLVFAVAMEGGAIKLFDSRSYDKVLTHNNIYVCQNPSFSNMYVKILHSFSKCRVPLTPF